MAQGTTRAGQPALKGAGHSATFFSSTCLLQPLLQPVLPLNHGASTSVPAVEAGAGG